jgi:hypothetical protein
MRIWVIVLLGSWLAFNARLPGLAFGQSRSGRPSPQGRDEIVRGAEARVKKWSKLGMWLPDRDVPFFKENIAVVEPILSAALANPDEKIRQNAAYVVGEIGPAALSLEPALIERIEKEHNRFVRLYLYGAAHSIGAKSQKMVALLRARFVAMEKEPDVRTNDADYTATDERIYLASALLKLDESNSRRLQYRDFVLGWLKQPPADLRGKKLDDYWEHRWIAVTSIENSGTPQEAIPYLQAMLTEPHRKGWVYVKVSGALDALKKGARASRVPVNGS